MKKLYAPWRSKYVTEDVHGKKAVADKDHCVFCTQFSEDEDERYLILQRTERCAVMMNLYPYNAGHLLILPLAHHANLSDLSVDERSELMELTNRSIEIVKASIKPDGFNLGMNLGKAAGAGIPSHLHLHVLPRWEGDTNFFPLLADTKAVSCDLREIYKELRSVFVIR